MTDIEINLTKALCVGAGVWYLVGFSRWLLYFVEWPFQRFGPIDGIENCPRWESQTLLHATGLISLGFTLLAISWLS